jgi:SAM-dependent methyltransferase
MAGEPTGPDGNTEAEYWNSAATRAWSEQHERQDRALVELANAALERAAPRAGERVLDIGCGSGTTVLELARRVGPDGHVLGADISRASVARARERIAAAGLRQAEAMCADVASHAFPPASFDLVFSRLGVMFFGDPTAAFANVRRAVKPQGRLVVAVFRSQGENPWPAAPHQAVRHLLPPPPPGRQLMPMFSWGDPARVKQILEGAGFREVSLAPVDLDYRLAGPDGGATEAADFALQFGPLTRILPDLPAERRAAVRSALEAFFQGYATPAGVALPAAFWLVQARA